MFSCMSKSKRKGGQNRKRKGSGGKKGRNYLFYTNKHAFEPGGDHIDNIHKKWMGNWDLLEANTRCFFSPQSLSLSCFSHTRFFAATPQSRRLDCLSFFLLASCGGYFLFTKRYLLFRAKKPTKAMQSLYKM